MFKTIKIRLTWMNAISYFIFLVLFMAVFYIAFAQIINQIQQDMVESYAANNREKFFTIYNGPPPPPNRFELEVNNTNFYYVISQDLEILYGEELHEGFNAVLEENLQTVTAKKFETYQYNGETLLVMLQPFKMQGQTLGYIAVGQNITSYKELLQNVLLLLIVLLIISSGGIAALSYFLAKKSMAPIQESYEQQRLFVANASHELRTPLAVLSSSLELFEEELQRERVPYPKESMDDIKNEANYMNDMLASLLYLTRSDQNQIRLNVTTVDVSQLVIQRTRTIAKTAPHLAFKIDVAEDVTLQADKTLLEELLYIVLKNAVTYTPEGTVQVRVRSLPSAVEIEIEDSGIGINAEDIPHIFERFYQADKVRNNGGTGLGLSIAKAITNLHNGKIQVVSTVNEGTTFTIILPK